MVIPELPAWWAHGRGKLFWEHCKVQEIAEKAQGSKRKLGVLFTCFHGYPPTWWDWIPLSSAHAPLKGEFKAKQQNHGVRWI